MGDAYQPLLFDRTGRTCCGHPMVRWGRSEHRTADGTAWTLQRWYCRTCGRTVRGGYPAGITHARQRANAMTQERVRQLLAAGLGCWSVARVLGTEGVSLSPSSVWRIGRKLGVR